MVGFWLPRRSAFSTPPAASADFSSFTALAILGRFVSSKSQTSAVVLLGENSGVPLSCCDHIPLSRLWPDSCLCAPSGAAPPLYRFCWSLIFQYLFIKPFTTQSAETDGLGAAFSNFPVP